MKFTIPKGRYCGACKFYYFDFAVCTLFRRQLWGLNLLRRCSLCLLDHPHGAVITIQNKEG